MTPAGVSVVIPTHNRVGFLRQAVRTVLNQVDVALQLVVVDDGSSDETPRFLASVEDPRLLVRRHERPRGVARARNEGLAHADYDWVAFLDDDDLWAPDKLARQLERTTTSVGWVTVGAVDVDADLRILGGAAPPSGGHQAVALHRTNTVPGGCSGVLARTSLLRRLDGFDTSLQTLADWDVWLRLSLLADMERVDAPLVAYRVHSSSMSHTDYRFLEELAVFRNKHRRTAGEHGVELDTAAYVGWYAENLLRSGNWPAYRRILRRTARRPRDLARLAVACAAPDRLRQRVAQRRLAAVPAGYRAARTWLEHQSGTPA